MRCTAVRVVQPLCPRGPRSGWGYVVPCPHRLLDPIRPSWERTATSSCGLIRGALAVRERLGDPQEVPCFRCLILVGMSPSSTPESPSAVIYPVPPPTILPSPIRQRLGTLDTPTIRFRWGQAFGATSSLSLQPADWLVSLADPTSLSRGPTETFTLGLSAVWSPFPLPSMTTVSTGQFPRAGLSPAGWTTSIAARRSPCRTSSSSWV